MDMRQPSQAVMKRLIMVTHRGQSRQHEGESGQADPQLGYLCGDLPALMPAASPPDQLAADLAIGTGSNQDGEMRTGG